MKLQRHVAQHGYGLAAFAIGMADMCDVNERMVQHLASRISQKVQIDSNVFDSGL